MGVRSTLSVIDTDRNFPFCKEKIYIGKRFSHIPSARVDIRPSGNSSWRKSRFLCQDTGKKDAL